MVIFKRPDPFAQKSQETMRKELLGERALMVSPATGSGARWIRAWRLSCVTWGKGIDFSDPYPVHL